jgi:hypothetical protein
MAIDQRDVSSTLRFMDDRALQQYAAMHKNDPYIFPLAFQESQNRQRLRMSQQRQAGAQPQPKVADQALAQMASQPLPEDVGIGALPAPNMTMAAEGGIMGYEGYDEGPSDFGQGPVMMMSGGGVARYQVGGVLDSARARVQTAQQRLYTYGLRQRQQDPAGFEMAQQEMAAAQDALQNAEREISGGPVGVLTQPIPAAGPSNAKITPIAKPEDVGGMDQRIKAGSLPNIPSLKTPLPEKPKDTKSKDSAQKAPAAPVSEKPSVLDPKAMFTTELEKTSKEVRPEKALLEKLIADRKKADEDELTALKGLNAKFADAFKSKRERLDTREGAIDKMKDQNLGLALLQAGARMMSTRGSVGEAIGAGVDTGSKQYVAGLDKINTAKDKLADARDRLDDLQLNRDEMSAREILKAENKIRQTALSGQETLIKYVMERDKVDRETAMKIVDNEVKIALNRDDNASREKVARISAEPALERNKLLQLANNKDDKVRTEYGKLQAKVMDTLSKDPNYTMANPMQQQVLQTTALRQALMSNPFLAPYAAGIGFSSAPTGGKVYDLTTD